MKKKLLFKNSTKYSKKVYNEFNRFHNNKYALSYDLFTIFILVLLIYCICVAIMNKIVFLSILFILILFVFIGYRIFNPIYFYKKESNKKSITEEKTFCFYFYDTYFKIRDNLDFDKRSYFSLYRVYETKKYFYLYVTKKYSFILDKAGFSHGSAEEFSKFIKSKIWFKYSKYKESRNKNSAKK